MSMVLLANHDEPQALRLKAFTTPLSTSRPHMELIMARLREADLNEGVSAMPGGGYYLKRAAYKINLAEIVEVVEEPEQALPWLDTSNKHDQDLAQQIWQELNGKLTSLLSGMSLAVLARQEAQRLKPRMGHTASMIATMFPAHHASLSTPVNRMVA